MNEELPDGITREELFNDILRYRACLKIERRTNRIIQVILGITYVVLLTLLFIR